MVGRLLRGPGKGEANRQRILDVVAARPGLTFRALTRASGVASGTCAHHRSILLRQERLVERRLGKQLRYFLPEQASGPLAILEAEPGIKAVADVLRARPGAIQKDVVAAFPAWPRATVQHRLQRLVSAGVATATPFGRRAIAYTLTSPATQAVVA